MEFKASHTLSAKDVCVINEKYLLLNLQFEQSPSKAFKSALRFVANVKKLTYFGHECDTAPQISYQGPNVPVILPDWDIWGSNSPLIL